MRRHVQIDHLEEFLTVVRYMNFTQAARKLNLAQSALSKHIASLEKEFDSVFFERGHQTVELTPQGRTFCVAAQEMLDIYRSTQERLKAARASVRLAGAVVDTAVMRLISTARTRIAQTDGTDAVSLHGDPSMPLFEYLLENRIDLYVDMEPEPEEADDDRVSSCLLANVPLALIVRREHPLANREEVRAQDLADQTIMYPTGNLGSVRGSEVIDRFLRRHGVSPARRVFFASSFKDFPLASMGDDVLVTPRSNFSKQFFPNIEQDYCSIPFAEADAVFPYHLVWRANERGEHVLRLRDELVRASEELYPGNRDLGA